MTCVIVQINRKQSTPPVVHAASSSVSATVAVAGADAARPQGGAESKSDDVVQQVRAVRDAMWQPEYRRIEIC